jgi:hypothetical protein
MAKKKEPSQRKRTMAELYVPDAEDKQLLKGKPDSYIKGWNKVKYRQSSEH